MFWLHADLFTKLKSEGLFSTEWIRKYVAILFIEHRLKGHIEVVKHPWVPSGTTFTAHEAQVYFFAKEQRPFSFQKLAATLEEIRSTGDPDVLDALIADINIRALAE